MFKPAGIPVFPPRQDPDGDCVLVRLLAEDPWRAETLWLEGFAGGIAHRLDGSTTGALLVADDAAELERIRHLFATRQLEKTYRFLAARDVPWDENECTASIGHDRRHSGRMVVQRGRSTPHRGRWFPAETDFRRVAGPLFEARMRTGVMHQIRVHAAFVGIPLLGDQRYGGGKPPADAPAGVTFFLHHLGIAGPEGLRTDPVPLPSWASLPPADRRV
ncbi:MAG: RNA pseudouridine synthase [Deltaproteobacteria bacterium]|nr:RNA pseudouridine synthase [Deltaproteobacteria bacterium]